jgi:hypothetical protein
MKTKFIFIGIVAFAAGLCAIFSLSSFTSQADGPQYTTMKVLEYSAIYDPRILIVYENGKTEEIDLEKPKNSGNITNNVRKINETLNKLSKKGYHLHSFTGELNFATYLFEKK